MVMLFNFIIILPMGKRVFIIKTVFYVAWINLIEFNRISIEVLSVVAVQVKCIQDAIKVNLINSLFRL